MKKLLLLMLLVLSCTFVFGQQQAQQGPQFEVVESAEEVIAKDSTIFIEIKETKRLPVTDAFLQGQIEATQAKINDLEKQIKLLIDQKLYLAGVLSLVRNKSKELRTKK